MENPLLSPFHSVDISLFTSKTAIPNSPCSPYLPAFLCRALAWAPHLGSGEAAAGDACCTQLPPSGQQQHFGLSKVVLASQTTNNFFSSLSLSQRNLFFSFSFVHVQDHKQHMRSVKYSWQLLLFNCTLLLQPTAIHFIPNSAFYFELSEQWDENFALKMFSVESGYHMCMEVLRAWCLPTEQGNRVGSK